MSTTSFAQSRATITGNVSDQFGNLPGAKVSIEGTNYVTTTDVNGLYTIDLEEGDYVVTATFVMYGSASKSVVLKVGETAELNFVLEAGFSIDQPISLGSRSQSRSLLQTTVPVDIITPQQIANSSQIELGQVLHYLVPSFHSTHQTISDGTDHIDPATLRGLGPDQVLVLINGKRRHNSSLLNVNGTVGRGAVGTDFNAIPIASIDRVEILRDGATSQYGSDAIAGVINIILKDQIDFIDLESRVGITHEGDGIDRYLGANFGFKIGNKGFLNISGEYRDRDAINRAGNYTGTVYSNDADQDAILIAQNNFFEQTGYDDQRVMEIGNAETQNLALSFNGEVALSNNANFYFHGGRNYREGTSHGFYRFPKDEDRVILELYPNGFSPEILTDIQDNAIVAGISGIKNGWAIDFSHSIGSNSLDYTVNNSNNASLGIASPRTFYSGGFVYKQNTTNIDLSKTYDILEGINFAFGGELRIENYLINAGEEASYIDGGSTYIEAFGDEQPRVAGAQVFPGIQPENELDRFRTNSAIYADIETNVTKALLLKTAGRYEAYNDFGGQAVWKLAGRYSFKEDLALRASFSTGFRAPSLHQVYFQSISSQFVNGEIIQVGTFNNESAITSQAFKIGNLKPELSKHFGIGFSGKVKDNLTFSFDYYQINIEDRIVLSGQFGAGYEAILEPFNVGAAQFFTNAIDSKTQGFDLSLNYKSNLGEGEFNTALAANLGRTRIDGPIKVSEALTGQEAVLFNREERSRVESVQPEFKVNALMSYKISDYTVQLGNTFFGGVKYVDPNDGDPANWITNDFTGNIESRDQDFKPKLLTNLSLTYQAEDWVKLTLGADNIFNVYPDRHTHSGNTSSGNFTYSRRVQQFGIRGSNYFLRLSVKL